MERKLNQEKNKVVSTNENGFLGFIFKGAKIRRSYKAFAKLRRRVKKLIGRSWGVLVAYRLAISIGLSRKGPYPPAKTLATLSIVGRNANNRG